ncbi:MAG: polysaccharide deacetylase family protein [Chitinophaga sp.]|jgi:peptidoglycan-N-acetylglucosamine deacetylase|nr:polysaccharide deacetylase family protein [Chitinophaga sp.]
MYLITSPWWLRICYPSLIWQMNAKGKNVYLTFDDGPHETVTPFVLDELKKYNAKATFFCIGKNVRTHTDIYKRIIEEGHAVGNHTFNHVNGWETDDITYLSDVANAATVIDSNLFRPPYGRIKLSQIKHLRNNYKIIMWNVLSGDFDTELSPQQCLLNVTENAGNGSIVVFHDSAKAWERLKIALPKSLEYLSAKGYQFKRLAL